MLQHGLSFASCLPLVLGSQEKAKDDAVQILHAFASKFEGVNTWMVSTGGNTEHMSPTMGGAAVFVEGGAICVVPLFKQLPCFAGFLREQPAP